MKSYLRIERLILVGVRKNYIVKFEDGLNIIHGDSDTGKSREGANKQVISSQADSLIKISRIWADF
ncbi:hypothetical protein LA438_17035, partial [Escherichia coli]|nr:hypothetical protein [Escherichia coli]